MKNITYDQTMMLTEEVSYIEDKIGKKVIVQTTQTNITLLAFCKGMKLPTHTSIGEVLLYVLEGTAHVTISEVEHIVREGQSIAIQANARHAVDAFEDFKMVVIVDFSVETEEMENERTNVLPAMPKSCR